MKSSYTLLDTIVFDSKLVNSVYYSFPTGQTSETRIFAKDRILQMPDFEDSNI